MKACLYYRMKSGLVIFDEGNSNEEKYALRNGNADKKAVSPKFSRVI